MDVGERLMERAKGKMISIVADDLYYAALNPSQAALMLYGLPPSTPKETIKLLDEVFVKKEKILEPKYVATLEKAVKFFKDVEHGVIKDVTGKQIDEMTKEVDEYLKRIKKLCSQIDKKTEKQRAFEFYDKCMKAINDVFLVENIKAKNVLNEFQKLVKQGKFNKDSIEILKKIIKIKENYSKLKKQEIDKIIRESSHLLRSLLEHVQKKRGAEIEKVRIRIKYGDKFGEIYLLGETAYIVNDIDAEEKEISKAKILPNGGLGEITKSSIVELEDSLASAQMPKRVFIKEKIFEDLRKLYGKDVEILMRS